MTGKVYAFHRLTALNGICPHGILTDHCDQAQTLPYCNRNIFFYIVVCKWIEKSLMLKRSS